MKVLVVCAMFATTGCFAASMGLRNGELTYSADGFMGPSPMEAAAADLTSAQAELVRAQARTVEAHPELLMGWRGYGYGSSYYGYGGYGRVDPSYYAPPTGSQPATATLPALQEQATDLEYRTSGIEQEAREIHTMLQEHIAEERSRQ